MSKADPHSTRHQEQRMCVNADQAEHAAILNGTSVIDSGIADEKIAEALDDFDSNDPTITQSWHSQDLKLDTAVGGTRDEIERRVLHMGASYPFEVVKNQLVYKKSPTGFYEFCLAVSLTPSLTKGDYCLLPRIFERVAVLLTDNFFGNYTKNLHLGAPREAEVGTTFYKGMQTLNSQSGEWIWSPEPHLPREPTEVGDEGIDFVIWKAIDNRPGKFFVLGQCACGEDWPTKYNDIDEKRIGKWFNPMSYVPWVKIFTTPHHVSRGNLYEAQPRAGMVFDRARLTILADKMQASPVLKPWYPKMEQMKDFVFNSGVKPIPFLKKKAKKKVVAKRAVRAS